MTCDCDPRAGHTCPVPWIDPEKWEQAMTEGKHVIELVGGCQDGLVMEFAWEAERSVDVATRETHVWDGESEILRPDNTRLRRFVLSKETT